jgi:transposase
LAQGIVMALAMMRTELSANDLRREARRAKDSDQTRRLLALALVLEEHSRSAAARQTGMDRQMLRDWVIRYNAEGWRVCATGRGPAGRRN